MTSAAPLVRIDPNGVSLQAKLTRGRACGRKSESSEGRGLAGPSARSAETGSARQGRDAGRPDMLPSCRRTWRSRADSSSGLLASRATATPLSFSPSRRHGPPGDRDFASRQWRQFVWLAADRLGSAPRAAWARAKPWTCLRSSSAVLTLLGSARSTGSNCARRAVQHRHRFVGRAALGQAACPGACSIQATSFWACRLPTSARARRSLRASPSR